MSTTIVSLLLNEFDQEMETTRKFLKILPEDKYEWAPHPKSMTIRRLAAHIAELPLWVKMALETDELDFAKNPYTDPQISGNTDLLEYFEKNVAAGRAALASATDKDLEPAWSLRNGEQIYLTVPTGSMIRVALSQNVHHRAQLGVFLRLLDIPIPGSYGPSADESF